MTLNKSIAINVTAVLASIAFLWGYSANTQTTAATIAKAAAASVQKDTDRNTADISIIKADAADDRRLSARRHERLESKIDALMMALRVPQPDGGTP